MIPTPTIVHSETLARLVRQSRAIHPDWDAETHLAWLADECIERTDKVTFWGGPLQTVEATVTYWVERPEMLR